MVPPRVRRSLWERLNGFTAPARGIAMLLKTKIVRVQPFSRTRVDFFRRGVHPDTGA
jgi:hypothetical protein